VSQAGVALITGANRGIGAALLRRFLRQNWLVHAVVRSEDTFDFGDVDATSRSAVRVHVADMSLASDIERLAEQVDGPIDVLINNAATFAPHAFYCRDFKFDEFAQTFQTNVIGPAYLAQKLHGQLAASRDKLIVMLSTGNASLAGNTSGQMLAYRASKTALNQVVRTMACEWKEDGIAIVALNPGWVRTRMGGDNAPLSPSEAADNIFSFVTSPAAQSCSGLFCNTDRSVLPW